MLSGALDRLRFDLLAVHEAKRSRYETALLDELTALDGFLRRMTAAPGERRAADSGAFVSIDLAPDSGDTRRLTCDKPDCPIKALG